MRIDPAARNGTVTVDIALDEALPRGARPDMSVDGTIELERLDNVLFVGRPAFGQEQTKMSLFKLSADRATAALTPVELGRSSVNTIEVVRGLNVGDCVVLTDMSQWADYDRLNLSGTRRPAAHRNYEDFMDQNLIKLDGVKKVFYTDEVETHALGGIHLEIAARRVRARLPGRRAAASRRCCRSSACSIRRPAASTG